MRSATAVRPGISTRVKSKEWAPPPTAAALNKGGGRHRREADACGVGGRETRGGGQTATGQAAGLRPRCGRAGVPGAASTAQNHPPSRRLAHPCWHMRTWRAAAWHAPSWPCVRYTSWRTPLSTSASTTEGCASSRQNLRRSRWVGGARRGLAQSAAAGRRRRVPAWLAACLPGQQPPQSQQQQLFGGP